MLLWCLIFALLVAEVQHLLHYPVLGWAPTTNVSTPPVNFGDHEPYPTPPINYQVHSLRPHTAARFWFRLLLGFSFGVLQKSLL